MTVECYDSNFTSFKMIIVINPSGSETWVLQHSSFFYTLRKQSLGCMYVRSSVRPSQSLIRYSSKTAEQNFMKLSGIVHYMMPYCTSYFKILLEWFWGFPEQNKDFATQNMGERGLSFFFQLVPRSLYIYWEVKFHTFSPTRPNYIVT